MGDILRLRRTLGPAFQSARPLGKRIDFRSRWSLLLSSSVVNATKCDTTKAQTAYRYLPPPLSFPPMSTILSLNFSFQALNAAYISCICAGEGCCGFCWGVRGALRWINRYFGILVLLWFFRQHKRQHPNDARRYADWTCLCNFFCVASAGTLILAHCRAPFEP